MASTVALNTIGGWVTYLNTKATVVSTGIHNITPQEIEAYSNGDGKSVILPFCLERSITLPTKESDAITASIQTFVFYNQYRIKLNVTYSGNAIA